MRGSTLVTSYLQAALFLGLGISCVLRWLDSRDKRSAHLAFATALFGINSLMGALSATIWDATLGEQAPRWWSIISSIIIYLSIYGFLLFLSGFIRFHVFFKALIIAATVFNIIMAFIERQEFTFKLTANGFERVPIEGVNNLIPYNAYLWYVIIYITIVFAVLAFSFILYGLRVSALAKFRMLSIGSGFTVLFIVFGLLPLLIFGDFGGRAAANLLNVIRYLALISAPMLYVGFAPPKALARKFTNTEAATVTQ